MEQERRRYKRFTATAFLRMPVRLAPVPPFFGRPVKGRLIDLSAGGMALLIDEVIPLNTRLKTVIVFPDQTQLNATALVRRLLPKEKKYMIGLEFQFIDSEMQAKIDRMSTDYIDCEARIREKKQEVCRTNCAFYSLCNKKEKLDPVVNVDVALEVAFQVLEETAVS
jgi:c-di-GMP-binding flagellar brake protein YcgR